MIFTSHLKIKRGSFEEAPAVTLNKDIFRFQIAMNKIEAVDILQGDEALFGDLFQTIQSEVKVFPWFSIVFVKLVKIISQQFRDNEEMFFVIEII